MIYDHPRDQGWARKIKKALLGCGVDIFIYEDIRPGGPFQDILEEKMKTVDASLILVGRSELEKWDKYNARLLVSQWEERRMHLIPVLLDRELGDQEPLLLHRLRPVDLRLGLNERKIHQLFWGITGRRSIASRAVDPLEGLGEEEPVWRALVGKVRADTEELLSELDLLKILAGSERSSLQPLSIPLAQVHSLEDEPGVSGPSIEELLGWSRKRGGQLLVLGPPGSGKTTLLHRIAQIAAENAQLDPTEPIPVVLDLERWSGRRFTVTSWLIAMLSGVLQVLTRPSYLSAFGFWFVEYLRNEYGSNKEFLFQVEQEGEFLLFIDGFDQMSSSDAKSFLKAFAGYCRRKGAIQFVLASCPVKLQGALLDAKVDLNIRNKTSLMPLDRQAVSSWLESSLRAGSETAEVILETIRENEHAARYADSPLGLAMLSRAIVYSDDSGEPLSAVHSREQLESRVVDTLAKGWPGPEIPRPKIVSYKRYLIWLARALKHCSYSKFYLEDLQPRWLDSFTGRWTYIVLSRVCLGLLLGIVWWQGEVEGLTFLGLGLYMGLVASFADGFRLEYRARQAERSRGRTAMIGWGLVYTASIVGVSVPVMKLDLLSVSTRGDQVIAWIVWLFMLLFFVFLGLRPVNREIHTFTFAWRPGLLQLWLLIGWLMGTGVLLLNRIMPASISPLIAAILIVTTPVIGVIAILTGCRADATISEEGLQPSSALRQTLSAACSACLVSALLVLSVPLWLLLFLDSDVSWSTFGGSLKIGAFFIVGVTLIFGGYDILRHGLLRMIALLQRKMPLRWENFLGYAVNKSILARKGRGYKFRYTKLRDHLATMDLSAFEEADEGRRSR